MSTAFRITNRSVNRTVMDGLQSNLARMQKLQEQLSSGKQVSRPSDSPVATVSAMQYRSELRQVEQYARNAQDGLAFLGATDQTLTGMLGDASRVRQLVLRGLNGTASAAEREALAAEVDALRSGLLDTANAKYLDRPIFAGTAKVDAAYDREDGTFLGNAADETATTVAGKVERGVAPGVSVRVNVTGPEVFGVRVDPDGPDGPAEITEHDLFSLLADISANLRTEPADTDALGENLSALDDRLLVIQNQLAKVGARYHQVEAMRTRAEDQKLTLTHGLSEVEDIDLPKTMVDLQLQEVAYQAALSATARVIQPSLLDFLR